MMNAEYYIKKLELEKHPEGGYFKEIYRSKNIIKSGYLPEIYEGERNQSTSIYFLLNKTDISKFHIIKSDEIWHFYSGSTIKIYIIDKQGNLTIKLLGNQLDKNESFQVIIPAEHYFAGEVVNKNMFGLVGCTVAPGFDFRDFYMPDISELSKMFPQHSLLFDKIQVS
jgi:uncharacterized protein